MRRTCPIKVSFCLIHILPYRILWCLLKASWHLTLHYSHIARVQATLRHNGCCQGTSRKYVVKGVCAAAPRVLLWLRIPAWEETKVSVGESSNSGVIFHIGHVQSNGPHWKFRLLLEIFTSGFYLFLVCLTLLWINQITWRLWIMNFKLYWRKLSWPNLRHHLRICQKGLTETTRNFRLVVSGPRFQPRNSGITSRSDSAATLRLLQRKYFAARPVLYRSNLYDDVYCDCIYWNLFHCGGLHVKLYYGNSNTFSPNWRKIFAIIFKSVPH
jgi:hypothetical protein